MSHTPGPWTQEGRLVTSDGDAIAMVNIARPIYQAYADARLIAAAPDLLAALKDARFALYGNGQSNQKIDAAIAKAEGHS